MNSQRPRTGKGQAAAVHEVRLHAPAPRRPEPPQRQPASSTLASDRSPTNPALRANPFPEVADLFCRLPLPGEKLHCSKSGWPWPSKVYQEDKITRVFQNTSWSPTAEFLMCVRVLFKLHGCASFSVPAGPNISVIGAIPKWKVTRKGLSCTGGQNCTGVCKNKNMAPLEWFAHSLCDSPQVELSSAEG